MGFILKLQDGSIVWLGFQSCHKQISPLHTILNSFVWVLKGLSRHQLYCNQFVTDSKISQNDNYTWGLTSCSWINEFKTLWNVYLDGKVVYQTRLSNSHVARHARTKNYVFSYVTTSVPYWMILAIHFLRIHTKIQLRIMS